MSTENYGFNETMDTDGKSKDLNGSPATAKTNDVPAPKIGLKKNVTMMNGIGLIVGSVIGSGIFISPTGILTEVNSVGLSLVVWLGCGLLAMFGCLCYTEMGTLIKKSGGEYAYLMEAFGKIPAFLFAWTAVIIIRPSAAAIISLIFADYVSKPFYPGCDAPVVVIKLLACLCLVTITAVNCWSVKWATRVQDTFTYAKLICLVILITIGLVEIGRGKTEHFKDSFKGSTTDAGKIGLAFYMGLWAFDGWNSLNYCTEEMKHPERDMPRSIIIGISMTTVCYLLANVGYFAVLGKSGILESQVVAISVGDLYLGPVNWIIPLFVAASTFGAVNGLVFTSGRLVYVVARDKMMPSILSMIHAKRLTPMPSIVFTILISIIMLIPESSSFMTLVDFFSVASWVFYGSTFAALLWLRWRRPDMNRPYKVWVIIPIGMLLASLYLIIAPITIDPMGSLVAIAIILAGLPIYYLFVVSDLVPQRFYIKVDELTCWFQKVFDLALEDQDDPSVDTQF